MNESEAVALIRDAVADRSGTWADLGAGDGTFTRALAEVLGSGSRIYAVDRDRRALDTIVDWAKSSAVDVVTVVADLGKPFDLPGLGDARLDGLLIANTLHYFKDAEAVLARLVGALGPGGRMILVEYDRRRGNPWVPHPIAVDRLPALTARAGLSEFVVLARKPSAYGGDLYVAAADKLQR